MRRSRAVFLVLIAAVIFMQQSHGGGKTQLRWVSFNDGIAEAKKTGKKVMIDVYTDWCGWCKKMDKNTYAEKSISDYVSSRYVAIRLNAESPTRLQFQERSYTEQELAAAFGVTGYPSIIFLNDDGEPITVYPGYADPAKFKLVLSFIAEDHYKTTTFQEYLNREE